MVRVFDKEGDMGMRIGLILENSQASRHGLVLGALERVAGIHGFEVDDYGMVAPDDEAQLTYVQNGVLAAALLNSGAVDYVVTGCGTGEGAMLALNSFPGVVCGHVEDPLDAYTFSQINDGNAVAIPFALKNGWGQELMLEYIFEKLWADEPGSGYPRDRAVPERRNKRILDGVRATAFRPLVDIYRDLDPELVRGAFAGPRFRELFKTHAKEGEIKNYVLGLLG